MVIYGQTWLSNLLGLQLLLLRVRATVLSVGLSVCPCAFPLQLPAYTAPRPRHGVPAAPHCIMDLSGSQ